MLYPSISNLLCDHVPFVFCAIENCDLTEGASDASLQKVRHKCVDDILRLVLKPILAVMEVNNADISISRPIPAFLT